MIDEQTPVIEFTAECRCDRCGAQAYTLAQREDLGDLLFCLHHRKQHYDALLDMGFEVVDDLQAIERMLEDENVRV